MKKYWLPIVICLGSGLALAGLTFAVLNHAVSQGAQDANYYQTMRVANDKSDFNFLLSTSAGRTGVNDTVFKAVDPVSLPEIKKEYMYIVRVQEHYTMKTRTYTTTDSKGHTQTHTETYWEWDVVDRTTKKSKHVFVNDVKVKTDIVPIDTELLKLDEKNVDLSQVENKSWFSAFGSKPKIKRDKYIYASGHDRFYYKVSPVEFKSTTFAELKDGQVSPLKNEKTLKLHNKSVQEIKKEKNESVESLMNLILPATIVAFVIGGIIAFAVLKSKGL